LAAILVATGKNPLQRVRRNSGEVSIAKTTTQRRLHKAFLRYHDPKNWPMLRDALKAMGRSDLIGNGRQHLIPSYWYTLYQLPVADTCHRNYRYQMLNSVTPDMPYNFGVLPLKPKAFVQSA